MKTFNIEMTEEQDAHVKQASIQLLDKLPAKAMLVQLHGVHDGIPFHINITRGPIALLVQSLADVHYATVQTPEKLDS